MTAIGSLSSFGLTNVTVLVGYPSPPPPSPPPAPPPGITTVLELSAAPLALAASVALDAASGAARVDYVNATSLNGSTWRTNRADAILFVAVFSLPVVDFSLSSVTVSGGGTVYNLTSSADGSNYTFGVRPTASTAALVVSVAAGAVRTAGGGANTGASLNVSYDSAAPVPTILSNSTKGYTTDTAIAFLINYGKVDAFHHDERESHA